MTGPRLISPRWLAAGGAVILAGALGVTLLLTNTGAACAAPPPTSAQNGKATFYDLGSGGTGNCSFPKSPADGLFVALGPDQYAAGAACGMYLDVTGPKGKVRVKVTDQCPECATGHLDLSRTAFKKIGAEVDGIIPISYRTFVNPAVPGNVSVTIKDGSSQWWLAVLIDNHGNQLKSVTVNGKATHRENYNYWIVDGGAGKGPFTIKVTNVYGTYATLTNIKLAAGTTQTTPVRAPGTTVAKAKAKAKAKAASTVPVKKKAAAPKPPVVATTGPAAPVIEAATEEPAPAESAVDLAAARCG